MGLLKPMKPPFRSWFLIIISATSKIAAAANNLATLDEALLTDILQAYNTHEASTCTSTATAATSFSFDWPGINEQSAWHDAFEPFEESLFQAIMSHNDTAGDRSWEIRIGTSGNIYSHFTKDMYGETLPPQKNADAPWIDEVQQTVSVNTNLNNKPEPYYIHQAGAYRRDPPYTDVPFFSPALAKHCSGNSCSFASWGTQAHVATPYTSPILYINKYTNCGNGIIEHTQMIHNFADPVTSTPLNVDQKYFNVGWGGVRSSSLPYALEPTGGILNFNDVNSVDYLPLCGWGLDDTAAAGRAQRTDINNLEGYTTFVGDGLLVNRTIPSILPCRIAEGCNLDNTANCMVDDCTEAQIAAGHTRLELAVPSNGPKCAFHTSPKPWNGLVALQCDLRENTGFGQTSPGLSSFDACAPWTKIQFYNTATGAVLDIAYVRHWSWGIGNRRVYFSVNIEDDGVAGDSTITPAREAGINLANIVFANSGSTAVPIEVRTTTPNIGSVPTDYDPASLPTFTFVYGEGNEYANNEVEGESRRRIGSTAQGDLTRDYTVFTINWWRGSTLEAGSTYFNRGFMFSSDLGSVQATASNLVTKTYIDKIALEDWSPRTIDIYQLGTSFSAVAASAAQGTSTTCSSSAALVCSGFSTPQSGYVPFFYIPCGSSTNTYFGNDPYHFTPPDVNNSVRSYVCANEEMAVRPTWRLMGFFDPDNSGCANLATATYADTLCAPTEEPSVSPSKIPSNIPSVAPSKYPTLSPSRTPSDQPTNNPTTSPSLSPSTTPSENPTSPTSAPTPAPTPPPTPEPTSVPSNDPSDEPTTSPSERPTSPPVMLPGFCSVGSGRCSESDLSQCSCQSAYSDVLHRRREHDGEFKQRKLPKKTPSPTPKPTNVPFGLVTKPPTTEPNSSPSESPTDQPSGSPTGPPPCVCLFPTPYSPTANPATTPLPQTTPNPTPAPTGSCVASDEWCDETTNCCNNCLLKGNKANTCI